MTAYLDHIERVNPQVNAIVSMRPRDVLLEEARRKDGLLAHGDYEGWLHGFPLAVKDLADVKGLKTTRGFFKPPFDVAPATEDSIFVHRLRAAGAIFIGKTNTSELGLGSHTYNKVFGTTLNAYEQSNTAGGSSGGAAVAVALRMLPVADGSDFMGSLRNPPGWNNVLGLRPSVGRVPSGDGEAFVAQAAVEGPIARTAEDLALMLDTMSGYDARAPLSLQVGPGLLADRGSSTLRGKKAIWFRDFGGYLPMEQEVLEVTEAAIASLEDLGLEVQQADELPAYGSFHGIEDLWSTWLILRHWLVGGMIKPIYDNQGMRAALKPEAVYEVEGLLYGPSGNGPISALEVFAGSQKRTDLYHAFRQVFRTYDYALLPTAQVMPFSADLAWPRTINGREMSSYHRWMEVTTVATLINAPTLAMPAGFGRSGQPIGLQVIGPNHADASLLELAALWERHGGWVQRSVPPLLGAAT